MDMLDVSFIDIGNLLDPTLVNSALSSTSMSIRWYPSRRCSCWGNILSVQTASGSPDPECPICGGLGRIYANFVDVTGVNLRGMQNLAQWSDSGVNYEGQITMICPYSSRNPALMQLYTEASLNDLIWAEDITLTTRTMIIRGEDVTRERPIGPAQITYGETTYTQDVDYRVVGTQIQWRPGKGPSTDARYEATYSFHPWFSIMFAMPVARNQSHLNLPRKFVLQLTPEYGESFPDG